MNANEDNLSCNTVRALHKYLTSYKLFFHVGIQPSWGFVMVVVDSITQCMAKDSQRQAAADSSHHHRYDDTLIMLLEKCHVCKKKPIVTLAASQQGFMGKIDISSKLCFPLVQ